MNIPVSNLVSYLKKRLDSDQNLKNINVTGEISNFHRHQSGHLYFTLKDEQAQISCVMFKSMTFSLRFIPKNGDKVVLTATVSVFEQSGQMQLYVSKIAKDGIGDLYQRFEDSRKKLFALGYFDNSHKKTFDIVYPTDIAVICGEGSAAMSDIKRTFDRRWPICKVSYYPSLVQGSNAPKDLIRNLKMADIGGHEAIIIARGGGSFEDLFCFNDEELVKAIYEASTLIVTGVGHEQDFTLVDFVSDLRASTPTAAVELLTPDIEDVIEEIADINNSLSSLIKRRFDKIAYETDLLCNNAFLLDPYAIINQKAMMLDYYLSRLLSNNTRYQDLQNQINIQLLNARNNISLKLFRIKKDYETNESVLSDLFAQKFKSAKNDFRRYCTLLEAYSLENTLRRGYALVYQNGMLKTRAADLISEPIAIRFKDGEIKARILEDERCQK